MATLTPNASSNFVLSAVLISVTSSFVILRLLITFHRQRVLQGPDWLCLFGTVVFNIYCGLIINYIFNVSKFHAFDNDPTLGLAEITNLAKLAYVTEILFGIGVTSIKLSILWFYFLLFSISRALGPLIKITAIVCVVWFIVATLVVVFQCKPVQAYWEKLDMAPYCLESPRVLLGYELSNLFIDIAILCIPTSTVLQLQLPPSKKILVVGIFLLGGVVCVFSILRLTAIWRPPNLVANFDFNLTYIYSSLQLGLAIVTSCLPTYGPLLPVFPWLYGSISSYYKTLRHSSSTSRSQGRHKVPGPNNPERPWIRVGDGQVEATSQSWAYGDNSSSAQFALQPMQPGGIVVNTRVDVD